MLFLNSVFIAKPSLLIFVSFSLISYKYINVSTKLLLFVNTKLLIICLLVLTGLYFSVLSINLFTSESISRVTLYSSDKPLYTFVVVDPKVIFELLISKSCNALIIVGIPIKSFGKVPKSIILPLKDKLLLILIIFLLIVNCDKPLFSNIFDASIKLIKFHLPIFESNEKALLNILDISVTLPVFQSFIS